MKNSSLTATKLRKVLATTFVLVILAIAGGFYYGLQIIREYAIEVTHVSEDAAASGQQIERLQQLRAQLEQTRQLVDKANLMFAKESTYQSQAITDIDRYASAAGITVTSTDFAQPDQLAANVRQVSLTFDEPVSYERLIHFLQLVETSLPKMQASDLTLQRPDGGTGDAVIVEKLTLNVSVR